jgi:hypothetical protein
MFVYLSCRFRILAILYHKPTGTKEEDGFMLWLMYSVKAYRGEIKVNTKEAEGSEIHHFIPIS